MIEITWRYDPEGPKQEPHPSTAEEALALLASGNRAYAAITPSGRDPVTHVIAVSADDLGLGSIPGRVPKQTPFAAVLGCADARVPVELVFLESANAIFAVRVAGNVLGAECVGSLDYALSHLPTVRLLAVIGHTGCGAVAAAVDAYLDPTRYLALSANLPMRAVIDAIIPSVRGAARALRMAHTTEVVSRPGYRRTLRDTSVIINAAVAAEALERMFADRLGEDRAVVFGIYDLASRQVGLPNTEGGSDAWSGGMFRPPEGQQFEDFVAGLVRTDFLVSALDCR